MKKLEKTQSQELNQASGGVSLKSVDEAKDYIVVCRNCGDLVTHSSETKSYCDNIIDAFYSKDIKCTNCGSIYSFIVEYRPSNTN